MVTDRPKKEWPEKITNSKGLHNCIDSNDQFSNHSSISLPTTYAGVTSGNKGETLKVSQQFNCNFHHSTNDNDENDINDNDDSDINDNYYPKIVKRTTSLSKGRTIECNKSKQ